MKSFIKGFNYAFKGIIRVIKEERNMRVHIAFALNVLIFAPFLKVTRVEYALLLLTIALVLSLETVNSAIENLSARVTKEKDELIKRTKDMAAGAVLIAAIFAVGIGITILCKPDELSLLFTSIFTNPLYVIGLLIFEAALLLFVVLHSKRK